MERACTAYAWVQWVGASAGGKVHNLPFVSPSHHKGDPVCACRCWRLALHSTGELAPYIAAYVTPACWRSLREKRERVRGDSNNLRGNEFWVMVCAAAS